MIEVKLSEEEAKAGAGAADLPQLVDALRRPPSCACGDL